MKTKVFLIVFNDIELVNDKLYLKKQSAEAELERVKSTDHRKGFEHFYEISEFEIEDEDEEK